MLNKPQKTLGLFELGICQLFNWRDGHQVMAKAHIAFGKAS
jgi:hypothetical protein